MKWWMIVGGIALAALIGLSTWSKQQARQARIERLDAVSAKSPAHDFSAKIFANCMIDVLADIKSCKKRVGQLADARGPEFAAAARATLPDVENAYFGR